MENIMQYLMEVPHKRLNPLTGEWVLVSPHRAQRPWQGKNEETHVNKGLTYDPECYLCPGNKRINGAENPKYQKTFVFTNDFGALLPDANKAEYRDSVLKAVTERGICKVICFSPDHSRTLPMMSVVEIEEVIDTLKQEYCELGKNPSINHVQIFENKGSAMGCSNPHPHGQIWAQDSVPNEVVKKGRNQSEYLKNKGRGLLEDYIELELSKGVRILHENSTFVSLVPFWAVWPFEAMILPKRRQANILSINETERRDFAEQIQLLTRKYDRLFQTSFPYSAGIHQSPTDGKKHDEWHWHMSFYPPLLRSATVKKFMVGYEMFGMPQRDITPEIAAERLKEA